MSHWEKVEKARQIMREVEDSHPAEDYQWSEGKGNERVRFPIDIKFEDLVEAASFDTIRKGFRAIDSKYPWKLSGDDGSERPRFGGENFHVFVQYAPQIIDILEIAEKRRTTPRDSFSRDDDQVKAMTDYKVRPFEEVKPYLRKAAFAGAMPQGFLGTLGNLLKYVDWANNTRWLEDKFGRLQDEYDKAVREIKDPWSRRYEDEHEREEALANVENEKLLKNGKSEAEKRAAHLASVRESGIVEGLDLDTIAKSLISLYRQYDASGVNAAFGAGLGGKDVRNREFGIDSPLYFEIPFDELVKKMKKSAKLGVSPNSYANLIVDFMNDGAVYGADTREAFERDLFKLFRQAREITERPDGYVVRGLLAGKNKGRSLPQTLGYESAKEFLLVAAEYGVDSNIIEKLVAQYGGSLGDEKNTQPSRLELLQSQKPHTKLVGVVGPLFAFDQRSRKAGVKVKTYGDREEDAKPLEYLLAEQRRDVLAQKGPEAVIALGDALLASRTPLQTFLDIDFYRQEFMQGDARNLTALMEEIIHEAYATWDREMLIKEAIPRSRVVISEVGLDQFLRNMRYCAEEGIDLPLALKWGLPVMEDAIVHELKGGNGNKQTAKKQYKSVLEALGTVEGVVSEDERQKLMGELQQKIDGESQTEVDKVNLYFKEIDRLNKAISDAGLEFETVYDYLRKEKFDTLPQFLDRSRDILEELVEIPKIIANRQYKPFETLTPEERTEATQRGLARYKELSELIRGDDNFDELAAEASQDFFRGGMFNIWDNIGGYGRVLGAMFSLVPLPEDEYQTILEGRKRYGEKKDQQGGMFSMTVKDPTRVGIATEMRKRQIAKGMGVAEIGGSVSNRVMEALGANTSYANGGYREGLLAVAFARSSMDVIEEPDKLIRLDHYKHKFGQQYDFTVTNKVFDSGSGVGAIAEGAGYGDSEDRLGTMELLTILSNITKNGGYSVHGGFTIDVPRKFMDYLGFDVVEGSRGWGQESLTILAKREPKPELFQDGFRIGYKTVDFNPETQEFYLRK